MDFSSVLISVGEHVRLTAIILAICLGIALPLGTLIARAGVLSGAIGGFFAMVNAIPSLALLACLVAVAGIGAREMMIALLGYALCVLLGSIVRGLRGVDPLVVDAARSLGISSRRILLWIEYPLALPTIVAGLRTATVIAIVVSALAASSAVGGLGRLLVDGIDNGSTSEIAAGVAALLLLAVTADAILRLVDRALPATRARAAARR